MGDAGALLTYGLSLSTVRALSIAFDEALGDGFDLIEDVTQFDMKLTYQFIEIEFASTLAITLAWLVSATLAGACDEAWLEEEQAAQQQGQLDVLRVVRRLLPGWLTAVPLAFVAKAIGVAAVILPVGGWLELDAPTAFADLGGMLFAVALWRCGLLSL